MPKIYKVPGEYKDYITYEHVDEYVSRDRSWSVWEEGGQYYLEYLSGEIMDRVIRIHISKEDYDLVRAEQVDFDYLMKRYGL